MIMNIIWISDEMIFEIEILFFKNFHNQSMIIE